MDKYVPETQLTNNNVVDCSTLFLTEIIDEFRWMRRDGDAKWTRRIGRGEMDEVRWTRQNYEMTGKLGFNLHLYYFNKNLYLYTTCEKFEEPFFSLGCLDKYKIML